RKTNASVEIMNGTRTKKRKSESTSRARDIARSTIRCLVDKSSVSVCGVPHSPDSCIAQPAAARFHLGSSKCHFQKHGNSEQNEDEPIERGAHFQNRRSERVPQGQRSHESIRDALMGPLGPTLRCSAETKPTDEHGKSDPSGVDNDVDPSKRNSEGEQQPEGIREEGKEEDENCDSKFAVAWNRLGLLQVHAETSIPPYRHIRVGSEEGDNSLPGQQDE